MNKSCFEYDFTMKKLCFKKYDFVFQKFVTLKLYMYLLLKVEILS